MRQLVTMSALMAALSIGAAADANAWTRSGSVTGWRGTATVHASGGCAYGACSRQITRSGPYGYSVSRQGSVACASGACVGSRTTTGPYGNTVVRYGTFYR